MKIYKFIKCFILKLFYKLLEYSNTYLFFIRLWVFSIIFTYGTIAILFAFLIILGFCTRVSVYILLSIQWILFSNYYNFITMCLLAIILISGPGDLSIDYYFRKKVTQFFANIKKD